MDNPYRSPTVQTSLPFDNSCSRGAWARKAAGLIGSAALSCVAVFLLHFKASPKFQQQLHEAIARQDYNHVTNMLAQGCVLATLYTSLVAGAVYLPACWTIDRKRHSSQAIPKGEWLWFAGGSGMLAGILVGITPLFSPFTIQTTMIIFPELGFFLAFAILAVRRRTGRSAGKWTMRSIIAWGVSSFWILLLFPLFVIALSEWAHRLP